MERTWVSSFFLRSIASTMALGLVSACALTVGPTPSANRAQAETRSAGTERNRVSASERTTDTIAKKRTQLEAQSHDERIAAGSVMARFPDKYSLEDSMNLDKVGAAIAEADLADFAVTVSQKGYDRRHLYWPAAHDHDSGTRAARSKNNPKHRPLIMWHYGSPTHCYVDSPPDLAPGTVGLVWTILPNRKALFVTLDGGRYQSEVRALALDLPKLGAWPAPLAFGNLHPNDIATLAAAGQLPAKLKDGWDAAVRGGQACWKKVWDAAEPRFQAIRRANILDGPMQRRINALGDVVFKQAHNRCGQWLAKAKSTWRAAVVARTNARRAAFERVKAKLEPRVTARRVASGN